MKQKKSIRCPYCGGTAILRDASFVYGEKSYGGKVYVCSNYPRCDAYVGVHPGTRIPKDHPLNDKRKPFNQRAAAGTLPDRIPGLVPGSRLLRGRVPLHSIRCSCYPQCHL